VTRPFRVGLCLAAVFVGACSDGDDKPDVRGGETLTESSTSTTSSTTPSPGAAQAEPPKLKAERVADLEGALSLAVRPGDAGLYVAQKSGLIRVVRNGRAAPEALVDLTEEVSVGYEQGLLGIAFNPAGDRLYANYTDTAGDTRIVEWEVDGGGRIRQGSRRELLFVDQPFTNHNGGHLQFGPDGFLYIALGDGGSGGDPRGNAQRLDTLLGKILRIDPRPDGDKPYRVPADNPFLGRSGARGEIWAYGLRNPWRFSFDPDGRLWIGDVGQNSVEEVDVSPAGSKGGENYGWNRREGLRPFRGGERPAGAVDPVHEYPTTDGCAVTGGVVYRGRSITGLVGTYLFADFCNGKVKGLVGGDGGRRMVDLDLEVPSLASFGEDGAGEVYVLSLERGLLRLAAA
jgi:glucose/arabinose dehydrogenase